MGKICHQLHQHWWEWNDQQKVKQERGSLQGCLPFIPSSQNLPKLWSSLGSAFAAFACLGNQSSPRTQASLVVLVLGQFHRKPGKEKNTRERDAGATWQLHWEIGQRTGFSEAWFEQLFHVRFPAFAFQLDGHGSTFCGSTVHRGRRQGKRKAAADSWRLSSPTAGACSTSSVCCLSWSPADRWLNVGKQWQTGEWKWIKYRIIYHSIS